MSAKIRFTDREAALTELAAQRARGAAASIWRDYSRFFDVYVIEIFV